MYVKDDYAIFRSTDAGGTWQKWIIDDEVKVTAMAISPLLNNNQHQLFVMTDAGDFQVLTPHLTTWEAITVDVP